MPPRCPSLSRATQQPSQFRPMKYNGIAMLRMSAVGRCISILSGARQAAFGLRVLLRRLRAAEALTRKRFGPGSNRRFAIAAIAERTGDDVTLVFGHGETRRSLYRSSLNSFFGSCRVREY